MPELAALDSPDRARVEALAGAGRDLNGQDRIDRPAVYRLKDEALRLAHGAAGRVRARRDGLAAYRAATPTWSGSPPSAPPASTTTTGGTGRPPTAIPAGPRWPAFGDQHRQEAGYAWLQWLLDEQLAAAGATKACWGW